MSAVEARGSFDVYPRTIVAWLIIVAVLFCSRFAFANPLIVVNESSGNENFPNNAIQTFDFATGALVNQFVPSGSANGVGEGVAVLGNSLYYTELPANRNADGIHVAPFNNGAGGADLTVFPNPRPGFAIADLATHNGVLYAMTGYSSSGPLEVFKLDPGTGAVLGPPVTLSTPGTTNADGFTVLPNGNFLMNLGDGVPTYQVFDAATGSPIGSPFSPGGSGTFGTGVDADTTNLYFFNQSIAPPLHFLKTDLSGNLIATSPPISVLFTPEDISLVDSPPDCSAAAASPVRLWPPNHQFVPVNITGVTDPDGDAVNVSVTGISQDEPVLATGIGSGSFCPDGSGIGTSTASIRAERDGTGNGRTYTISFTATDPAGLSCNGQVTVCVPHDLSNGGTCGSGTGTFDSTVCP